MQRHTYNFGNGLRVSFPMEIPTFYGTDLQYFQNALNALHKLFRSIHLERDAGNSDKMMIIMEKQKDKLEKQQEQIHALQKSFTKQQEKAKMVEEIMKKKQDEIENQQKLYEQMRMQNVDLVKKAQMADEIMKKQQENIVKQQETTKMIEEMMKKQKNEIENQRKLHKTLIERTKKQEERIKKQEKSVTILEKTTMKIQTSRSKSNSQKEQKYASSMKDELKKEIEELKQQVKDLRQEIPKLKQDVVPTEVLSPMFDELNNDIKSLKQQVSDIKEKQQVKSIKQENEVPKPHWDKKRNVQKLKANLADDKKDEPCKKEEDTEENHQYMVVMTGLRDNPNKKQDDEMIQAKIDQLQGHSNDKNKFYRMGKFKPSKFRNRDVVLYFETKKEADQFLDKRESFIKLDGAINVRKYRSKSEIRTFKLKLQESKRFAWLHQKRVRRGYRPYPYRRYYYRS